MKNTFGYIFRSKGGILFITCGTAAVMLITSVIAAIPGIREYFIVKHYLKTEPEVIVHSYMDNKRDMDVWEYFEKMKEWQFANGNMTMITAFAAGASVIFFVLMLRGIFGMFTANGVSRRRMMLTMFGSVPVSALTVSAALHLIRYVLVRFTIFFWDSSSMYIHDMLIDLMMPEIAAGMEYVPYDLYRRTLPGVFYLRSALLLFAVLTVLFSVVVFIYAMYRRSGIYGMICSTLSAVSVFFFVNLMLESTSVFARKFISAFLRTYKFDIDTNYYYNEIITLSYPKVLPVTAAVLVISAAAFAAGYICLRRCAVRRTV